MLSQPVPEGGGELVVLGLQREIHVGSGRAPDIGVTLVGAG